MIQNKDEQAKLPDTLTQQIGVLIQREVEARILAPIIDALVEKFGRDRLSAVVKDAVIKIAQQQGDVLAGAMGGCSAGSYYASTTLAP